MEDNAWKSRLSSALFSAWQQQLYTDLTIVTQDQTIEVHKLVLAVSSPYFRALLSANLSESHSNMLKLESVRGETLKVVLEYVYSGRAHLTEENVSQILSLADYFQIHDLKRLCCMYIKNHLTPYSCLHIYELALLHLCPDLANVAFEMALKNCSEVIREPSFLTLQPTTLLELFKQQILDIASEDELFKALQAWFAYSKEDRNKWYCNLLGLLNVDQLNPLTRGVFQEELEENEMEGARDVALVNMEEQGKALASRHKKENEVLIVFGGESSGRILGTAESFAIGYVSWSCSIPLVSKEENHLELVEGQQVIPAMKQRRAYAAIASKDNVIYLIGGQCSNHFLNSCETYHVDSNEWGSFPDLPMRLHAAEATFLQDKLCVVGGRSEEGSCIQKSLLVYNNDKTNWTFMSPMLNGRVHFGLAALHGCLYVVGGLGVTDSDGRTILSSCEKYDVETDTWIPIAPLSRGRAYHGVSAVGDFLYAVGGYDGAKWLSAVERYDPLQDTWCTVSPMIGTRSSFGVTVSNGRIYCIGGFSGESLLNTVEKYNPKTDMWHRVQSMQFRRYGLMSSTLTFPSERLKSRQYGYHRSGR